MWKNYKIKIRQNLIGKTGSHLKIILCQLGIQNFLCIGMSNTHVKKIRPRVNVKTNFELLCPNRPN